MVRYHNISIFFLKSQNFDGEHLKLNRKYWQGSDNFSEILFQKSSVSDLLFIGRYYFQQKQMLPFPVLNSSGNDS